MKKQVLVPAGFIILLLMVIALPTFFRARRQARRNAEDQMRKTEQAQDEYSLEYGTNSSITWEDVDKYVLDVGGQCYVDGIHSLDGHVLINSRWYRPLISNGIHYIKKNGELVEITNTSGLWRVKEPIPTKHYGTSVNRRP